MNTFPAYDRKEIQLQNVHVLELIFAHLMYTPHRPFCTPVKITNGLYKDFYSLEIPDLCLIWRKKNSILNNHVTSIVINIIYLYTNVYVI